MVALDLAGGDGFDLVEQLLDEGKGPLLGRIRPARAVAEVALLVGLVSSQEVPAVNSFVPAIS